ncbi:unnamed protein product [Acanthosepion pharaonis]|uniref:Uncharacterized protein n=1 Tax=Acanthosepion pharaonis TaxID=158019 RepID=A0A812CTM9_ACAPH|nr:unnamed protein product [Sepia pharaonis]
MLCYHSFFLSFYFLLSLLSFFFLSVCLSACFSFILSLSLSFVSLSHDYFSVSDMLLHAETYSRPLSHSLFLFLPFIMFDYVIIRLFTLPLFCLSLSCPTYIHISLPSHTHLFSVVLFSHSLPFISHSFSFSSPSLSLSLSLSLARSLSCDSFSHLISFFYPLAVTVCYDYLPLIHALSLSLSLPPLYLSFSLSFFLSFL